MTYSAIAMCLYNDQKKAIEDLCGFTPDHFEFTKYCISSPVLSCLFVMIDILSSMIKQNEEYI